MSSLATNFPDTQSAKVSRRPFSAIKHSFSFTSGGFSTIIPGVLGTASCDFSDFPLSLENSNDSCTITIEIQESWVHLLVQKEQPLTQPRGGLCSSLWLSRVPSNLTIWIEYHFPFNVVIYTGAIVAVCAMGKWQRNTEVKINWSRPVILQLRTYALYSKSKKVLCLFCVLNSIAVGFFIIQLTIFNREFIWYLSGISSWNVKQVSVTMLLWKIQSSGWSILAPKRTIRPYFGRHSCSTKWQPSPWWLLNYGRRWGSPALPQSKVLAPTLQTS